MNHNQYDVEVAEIESTKEVAKHRQEQVTARHEAWALVLAKASPYLALLLIVVVLCGALLVALEVLL